MSNTESWKNIAVSLVVVEKGSDVAVEVEGGYVRGIAPQDGFILHVKSGYKVYVPGDLFIEDLSEDFCTVKNCNGARGKGTGSLCDSCWLFVSGEAGGDDSIARANALAFVKKKAR